MDYLDCDQYVVDDYLDYLLEQDSFSKKNNPVLRRMGLFFLRRGGRMEETNRAGLGEEKSNTQTYDAILSVGSTSSFCDNSVFGRVRDTSSVSRGSVLYGVL